MTEQEMFQYWLDHAQYDLDTAEAMLSTGRWLYVVFMCQQAIEKLVKGLYGLYIDFDTPRTHNITRIIEEFEKRLPRPIEMSIKHFLNSLTYYYLNGRYPNFKEELSIEINEPTATNIYGQTQEVFKCLLSLKP